MYYHCLTPAEIQLSLHRYDMNGMGAIVRSIGKCSGSTPNSSTFEQCYCTEWASNNSCTRKQKPSFSLRK
jgi:hypothetical protein